jgi:hypothetical protein
MQSRQISMKGRLNTVLFRKNSQDSPVLSDPKSLAAEYCRVSISVNAAE